MRRETFSLASTCKNIPVFGVISCLPLFADVVNFINTKTADTIEKPLYCSTHQINILIIDLIL